MKRQSGFSLIELMVVVAIMLVIAAFAIPAVVSANQASHESGAVNTLRQTITAENSFSQLYPTKGFSTGAKALGGTQAQGCPASPDPAATWSCLLADDVAKVLDGGNLGGYTYNYTPGQPDANGVINTWTLDATPTTANSGRKSYFADQSGTIRYNFCAAGAACAKATAASPMLGQ